MYRLITRLYLSVSRFSKRQTPNHKSKGSESCDAHSFSSMPNFPRTAHMNLSSKPSHLLSALTFIKKCKLQTHLHQVHCHIIKKGLERDHSLIAHFISLCHSLFTPLSYSTAVFNCIVNPNTFLWNTLLKGYSQNSLFVEVFVIFIRLIREEAVPDKYTFPLVIKACSNAFSMREGTAIHASVIKSGVDEDVFVGTSLIDLYGKRKEILGARKVFDEMSVRNVVTWTAMVVAYVSFGDLVEAKRVFDLMPDRSAVSWNALIGGLAKVGDLRRARQLFDEMPGRNVVSYTTMIDGYAKAGDMASASFLFEAAPDRDIVAWSALISGYAQNGQPNEAVKIFSDMCSKNIEPDEYILVSLMSACSQVGNLELARWVDSYLSANQMDLSRAHVIASLIDMNAKCGNMDRATELFETMANRDVISYCSMIKGLSIHGHGAQAVSLFNRMISEGLIPDEVAFTIVLTACSHAGLVEEGLHFFESMQNVYTIVPFPEHYACMVDLLARTGHLKAAYELLNSMPLEPHASAWGALLEACKLYSDIELGELVANKLFELEPRSAGTFVLLSNIYAAAERWLDVSLVRSKMKERGVRKIPGCSSL